MLAGMIERIKGIILSPAKEWTKIQREKNNVGTLIFTWVLPLMAITFVCILIGTGLLTRYVGFSYGIASAIIAVIIQVIILFVMAFIADILAPNFGGKRDFNRSFALVVYSMVPSWVAGVFYIIPGLGSLIVGLASLYGLYILYVGIRPMKAIPKTKTLTYFVVLLITWLVAYVIFVVALTVTLTILILKIIDPTAGAALGWASQFGVRF